MDAIIYTFVIYLFLLVLFRMSGKRALAEMRTFDFILLLLVGEAAGETLHQSSPSFMTAILIVTALVGIDVLFSILARKWGLLGLMIDGVPVIVVEDGKPIESRMKQGKIEMDDILQAARRLQGLESLDQIKYAVLEQDGKISIIPKSTDKNA